MKVEAGSHTIQEIRDILAKVALVAVATASGDEIRTRLMHYAYQDDFTIYLASVKGDPKVVQMTRQPSISLLIADTSGQFPEMKEVEITGRAVMVNNEEERQRAFTLEAPRSPIVGYLYQNNQTSVLDCIRVVPQVVKFRVAGEVVQGQSPTVVTFPQNRSPVSDWALLKKKALSLWMAMRFPFLTASLVPALLGTAVAYLAVGAINWLLFLLTVLGALMVHAGTNVLNDYFDHRSGNDPVNVEFVRPFSGGSRVIQLGLLTPLEVLSLGLLLCLGAMGIGIYLAFAAGPWVVAIAGVGILSGAFYVSKPFNWASRGLGELLVGINFGVLVAAGAYYVQTGTVSWQVVLASLPVAFLIAAVLFINEFPDYKADLSTGKRTLVVRLGRPRAAVLYVAMMIAPHVVLVAVVATGWLPTVTLVGLVSLLLTFRACQTALKFSEASLDLAPANALTIIVHLSTGLLITWAFIWEALGLDGVVWAGIIGVAFTAFITYMYFDVEHQKKVFLNLRKAVS